jgi:hypothetical protein
MREKAPWQPINFGESPTDKPATSPVRCCRRHLAVHLRLGGVGAAIVPERNPRAGRQRQKLEITAGIGNATAGSNGKDVSISHPGRDGAGRRYRPSCRGITCWCQNKRQNRRCHYQHKPPSDG